MTEACPNRRSLCPVSYALDVFGDKWTLLIVRDLMFFGRRTYGAFLEAGEGIATNILASRLARLEQAGLVNKERDATKRNRYLYTLTSKGRDLLPVLLEMVRWSARYDADTAAPKAFIRRLEADRDAVIIDILNKLERGGALGSDG